MRVIVVDNFHWNKGCDELNRKLENFDSVICTFKDEVPKDYEIVRKELLETAEIALSDDEEYYYLINIHCVFKNPEEPKPKEYFLQDQLGVLLYRQLLKAYEKSPDKLKVGFFSPVYQKELIKRMPENYVISLFPFFESPFTWDECCKTFTQWNNYPVFNTASENLLTGYKIYCSDETGDLNKQVATGSKKIVFIDDQTNEWEATFNEIFKAGATQTLPYKNQQEFRANFLNRHNSDFIKELEKKLDGL